MTLPLSLTAFIASVLLLYVGSKKVVHAAGRLAASLNFHRVVVGTVFVASVTSAPELFSSLIAAFYSSSQMAFGNIIGSNIYNIPLIVGICGLIREFKIKNSTISRECIFMIGLCILLVLLTSTTGLVTWWMGLVFLAFYPAFIYHSIRKGNGKGNTDEKSGENPYKSAALMIVGGSALIAGTFLLVFSATKMAAAFGLTEFNAGLTIMALGCVVPETAVSVAAAVHGEQEISIGNAIGDNIITLTLVLGLVGLFKNPIRVSLYEVFSTTPFMILVTLALFIMNRQKHRITRAWSIFMLIIAAFAFTYALLNNIL
ncbi:MAG: calcium/sodium antiporter [Candidatus Bathyarchaeia archaeon]